MHSLIELVTVIYGITNVARIAAYVPQLRCLLRNPGNTAAVSTTTWWMFCASHVTTALYMALVTGAMLPTLIFSANAVCSAAIAWLARKPVPCAA